MKQEKSKIKNNNSNNTTAGKKRLGERYQQVESTLYT